MRTTGKRGRSVVPLLLVLTAGCGSGSEPLIDGGDGSAPPPDRFVAVAAGSAHSCGVTELGWVRCWGSNSAGQLGNGSWGPGAEPLPLAAAQGSEAFASVDLGRDHTCALTPQREIWCWGSDASRQLGYLDDQPLESCGAVACSTFPRAVIPGTRFRTFATGEAHTCAGASLGTLYCWGANAAGQTGSGGPSERVTYAWPVDGQHLFATVRAGASHTCGVTLEGETFCWGSNESGQLGTTVECREFLGSCAAPVSVAVPAAFVQLALGEAHSCALTEAGEAWCWGDGSSGALGHGGRDDRPLPVRVETDLRFTVLTAGGAHTCGLTEAGEAWCWGAGARGRLGDGDGSDATRPRRVEAAGPLVSISAGGAHTCAADADGGAWCWGANEKGQIGDGTTADRDRPVRVGEG